MAHKPIVNKRIKRKSRKEEWNGPSVNKYAHLVPKRPGLYNSKDKTFRDLPFIGSPGEVIKAGTRVTFHGRLYELMKDLKIPSVSVVPSLVSGKEMGIGRCKFVAQIG